MHTGMLWFSNDALKPIETKIKEAVDYYVKKYNRQPDLCLVHPNMVEDKSRQLEISVGTGKIKVRPYKPVLPGHIWIGVEDKE